MNYRNFAQSKWNKQYMKYILDNKDKPWNYICLSWNPNITFEIVKDNPDKPWDYECLSGNPNITWEIVKANPDKKWSYHWLSNNPSITWEIVQANPDKPWAYSFLSNNPNITWEIFQDNPDIPWNYNRLSENTMFKSKEAFIKKEVELIYDFSYRCAITKVIRYLMHPERYLGRKCIMELSNII